MKNVFAWKLSVTKNDYTLEKLEFSSKITNLNGMSPILPAGVYTTLRTYDHNNVLPLQAHFERLEESARLAGKPVTLDRQLLRIALHSVLPNIHFKDSRIRITLDLEQHPGTTFLAFEPLKTPKKKDYLNGVRTISHQYKRKDPQAKLTGFLSEARKILETTDSSINEVLLVDERGAIYEGVSSNFFTIKNGCVYTSDQDILMGIIRSIALRAAKELEIPIHYEFSNLGDISGFEESFITSASRGILPVVNIDNTDIGDGKPGKMTQRLMMEYNKILKTELEVL
jgi:branched-chain amino acid aminotransferase